MTGSQLGLSNMKIFYTSNIETPKFISTQCYIPFVTQMHHIAKMFVPQISQTIHGVLYIFPIPKKVNIGFTKLFIALSPNEQSCNEHHSQVTSDFDEIQSISEAMATLEEQMGHCTQLIQLNT